VGGRKATDVTPRKRAAARRGQILDAAARSFRETGYGGASLDTVASAVGILKGSLYYHFASKEEILAELLIDVHRDALVMIEGVTATGGTGMERVEAYVAAHASWAVRHLDRVEVFLREYHHLPDKRAREVAALRRRFSDYLTECIAQAQREGVADPTLDARVAANSIHGMLNWIGHWYRSAPGLSEQALVAQITRQAVRGLTPPPRARTSSCSRMVPGPVPPAKASAHRSG
jgi:AcrR family transcriptional regulator